MKNLLICFFVCFYCVLINAQAVYVDSNTGDDKNSGTKEAPVYSIGKAAEIIGIKNNDIYTIKINPGFYALEKHVSFSSEKDLNNKRIIIEAAVLPEDTAWNSEKMPVVICGEKKGEDNFAVAFLVDESHVTIRGINFHGYPYPNARYFPVARFNKQKTDLLVEQCMFIGDRDASSIQVGIIAHGNEVKIDHCVFYNPNNAIVYWQDSGDSVKTGNSFTNCIVYGANVCAVWLAWPDRDFVFNNNVITNCKYALIKDDFNSFKYSIENSVIVNNKFYTGIAANKGLNPDAFNINENNIVKTGEVSLRMIDENVDDVIPIDYLHVIPNTLGYNLGAGLFKNKKQ